MFIYDLNRLVYEEGKLIGRAPSGIPKGTTIKIEWDGGCDILQSSKCFEKGGDDFTVSETISTDYALSDISDYITINGETLEKFKGYQSYIFTVKFENKEPLYSVEYEIIYYPEFFQMGQTLKCLSIKCMFGGSRFFKNLKISCPECVEPCKQKLALSMLLNGRLSEHSPIETNLDIISLISKFINKYYYPDDHNWESWEKVAEAGYYDYGDHGFGGGGGKKKKRKTKKKKRKTKRRKSKRKKHKTKRRKS